MSRRLKIALYVIGSFATLGLLAVGAALLFLNTNAFKPQVEATASKALGMQVQVDGPIGISIFPDLHITLKNVRVDNRGTNVANVKNVHLNVDLSGLLRDELHVREIRLKQAFILIERAQDGTLNIDRPISDDAGKASNLAGISVSDATLRYTDHKSGTEFEISQCSAQGKNLRRAPGKPSEAVKNLSLTAEIVCDNVNAKRIAASDVRLTIALERGVLDIDPITMRVFGGNGSARVRADFSKAIPLVQVRYSLSQFLIEEFLAGLKTPQKVAHGPMDFALDVAMQGETMDDLMRTMEGTASLRGHNITLESGDLDEELSRFESSQRFNLVDVGAYFFVGPAALLVTKGYNFASILVGKKGESNIRTLVSDWKIEHGVAQAQDVAMATDHHRIALQGALDFVNEQFDDVVVALIDSAGCAKVQQKIRGPFSEPVVEKPNVLATLAEPALKLLRGARKLLTGKKCKPFYTGSVTPPSP